MSNLKELKHAIRSVPGVTSVSLVRFETMTFREQLETIRQSHIVLGIHGAGLSHIMFMNSSSGNATTDQQTNLQIQQQQQQPKSSSPTPTLIEFLSSSTDDYFGYLATCKGVQFYGIDPESYEVTFLKSHIIAKARDIVQSTLSSSSP